MPPSVVRSSLPRRVQTKIGYYLTEDQIDMPPYQGELDSSPGMQVIKIVQLAAHGGLPFEVDVWRDVDCARSLIAADWAAAFGAVAAAYSHSPPGHPRFLASPVVMGALGKESVWPCLVDVDGLFLLPGRMPTSMDIESWAFQI